MERSKQLKENGLVKYKHGQKGNNNKYNIDQVSIIFINCRIQKCLKEKSSSKKMWIDSW